MRQRCKTVCRKLLSKFRIYGRWKSISSQTRVRHSTIPRQHLAPITNAEVVPCQNETSLFHRLCTREIYRLFAFLFLELLRWVLVLLCTVCRLPLVARAGTVGGRWTHLTFPSCLSPPRLLSEGLIRFDEDGVSSRLRFNCLDCVGGVWTVDLESKPQATL